MKKTVVLFLAALSLIACSSEDEDTKATNATITVQTASGTPVSGITVYSFQDVYWENYGDDSFFADASVITDDMGQAKFENIEYLGTYFSSKQENFHFSAHYSKNGTNYKRAIGYTIKKGESKKYTITVE